MVCGFSMDGLIVLDIDYSNNNNNLVTYLITAANNDMAC